MKKILRFLLYLFLLPYALTIIYCLIPPSSTLMLADLASFSLPKRNWVSLKHISPNLVQAVLVAEDSAFCDHFGVDFEQLGKSIERAQEHNKPMRGASTITQQTAKNLFLWQGRSWLRKALEIPLTFWLEIVWSKHRIIEVYLNVAEWGDGIYGAEAASRLYFGIPASQLSPYQAALLAASLPNPRERNPARPGGYQLNYAGQILARMQKSGADVSCLK